MAEHAIFVIGGDDDEQIQLVTENIGQTCRITCRVRDETFTADEDDFFEALGTVRRRALEPKGLIPFCYGASLHVWPSGMARDMGQGLKAYKMKMGVPATELVGIFDQGPDVIPSRFEQQTEFAKEWIGSLRNRRRVEGYVLTLKCRRCGSKSPHAVFSGDTDMATDGLISLTSGERNELVVGELTAEEWTLEENARDSAACQRVSVALARTDLRPVRVIRWENSQPIAGLPFALFRKAYKPPVGVYSCPKCGGEAKSIAKQSWTEFMTSGGHIEPFGQLVLYDPSQINRQ
uniref:hypothetical protein n=1 Tax=uncultured Caulobacter sp. TaxID=158749 RepID=UPI0025F48C9C|nr:hypothetical protein [uncultured Caulobacter sp.]